MIMGRDLAWFIFLSKQDANNEDSKWLVKIVKHLAAILSLKVVSQ